MSNSSKNMEVTGPNVEREQSFLIANNTLSASSSGDLVPMGGVVTAAPPTLKTLSKGNNGGPIPPLSRTRTVLVFVAVAASLLCSVPIAWWLFIHDQPSPSVGEAAQPVAVMISLPSGLVGLPCRDLYPNDTSVLFQYASFGEPYIYTSCYCNDQGLVVLIDPPLEENVLDWVSNVGDELNIEPDLGPINCLGASYGENGGSHNVSGRALQPVGQSLKSLEDLLG